MRRAIVIPARYASSRYPGKPLVKLIGKDGVEKPLIEWTYEVALKARQIAPGIFSDVILTSDDDRVLDEMVRIARLDHRTWVVRTGSSCRNGTERVAAAVLVPTQIVAGPGDTFVRPDVVVNLQGDSPLCHPMWIVNIATAVHGGVEVVTPCVRASLDYTMLLRQMRRDGYTGETTVVRAGSSALYFSKEVIPPGGPVLVHVGLYAYATRALRTYLTSEPGELEREEGLEQLRFLENGCPIKVIEVEGNDHHELNRAIDVHAVERGLQARAW